MKKNLLITMLLGTALAASADDYAYLNIVKADGTGISLPATEATITFADGYLVTGSEKILLSELSVMQFSNESVSSTTAISSPTEADTDFSLSDADAVYDLNGRQLSTDAQLRPGVYIIKKGNTTKKIQVK